MQVSLNWVREFCPFETGESPREVGTRFSLHTAEVESVAMRCAGLERVVASRAVRVRPHPDSERLEVVEVEIGPGTAVEVVSGAPNVREGLVAPYAPPGTALEGGTVEEVAIRGVVSRGMLCSERELGISSEAAGLWELPGDARPGTPLYELFPALRDVVLEIDNKSLTHRPDLWGHYGIAREFSAIYRTPLAPLRVDERLASRPGVSAVRVSLAGEGVGGREGMCRRYCGLQIDGVRVGPSPDWIRHRLLAVGTRPISNVVDVTNYVLHEIGQPLHAFDVAKVSGGEIVVRRGAPGERLRLLDGSDVELTPDDCVIADAREAVALAGVMGGAGSEISEGTTSVFLESANFAAARIRRTSIRVGKRTDSSLRFEKSLDPENARIGILRAARMVLDLCPGARVVGPLQDVGYEPPPPVEIRTTAAFVARRLGVEVPAAEVRDGLRRLGFRVAGRLSGEWTVRVPSWRATKDVSIPEDLVEEVGRIHGYDRIPPFPPAWNVEAPAGNARRKAERAAKQFLVLAGGLSEVFTYAMVGEAHCRRFGLDPRTHLKLKNPISEELDRLRREIVPIHLEKARENQKYAKSFGFFELGRVYAKPADRLTEPELPDERRRLAGIVCFEEKRPEDFYKVRDLVLGLLEELRVRDPIVRSRGALGDPPVEPWAHPQVYARVFAAGSPVGSIYRVHPATEALLELAGDTIAFDLDFDAVFESPRREIAYAPPLRFPTVPFDVAVVAPEKTEAREILEVIRRAAGERLLSLEVFDVFRGAQAGPGKKSIAVHVVFGARERTLEGAEVTELEARVVEALREAGFPLRA